MNSRHLITAIGLCIIFWPPILELYSADQDESNYREIQPDQLRIAITFSKATKQDDFPQPYSIIDSLLLEFQGWLFQYPGYTSTVHPEGYKYWDESDIPYDLMLSFAKALVWKDFYSDEYYHEYIRIANAPSKAQSKRFDEVVARGELFDEVFLPMPGFILNTYIVERQIKKHLPWQWYYLLRNRYILVVEPIQKDRHWIDPDVQMMKADFYQCNIVDDVKGSYDGPDTAQFVTNYLQGITTKMEIGKQYLVLIPMRSTAGNYGPTYLIRGIATEGRGIFPVVESRILDTELKLRQQEVMSVHTYKQAIQSFIHNTAGVRYEE